MDYPSRPIDLNRRRRQFLPGNHFAVAEEDAGSVVIEGGRGDGLPG
jgi:hypothetical protein